MSGVEGMLLAAGSGCYVVSAGLAWRRRWRGVGHWILLGAAVFAAAIAVRWTALGQGPFLTMFEILVSSLFSLGLVFGIACLRFPEACRGAPVATGVLLILAAWMAFADPQGTPLPATYGNPWLWVHVLTGKLFLGCCLVASSLAATALLGLGDSALRGARLDQVAWRWLMLAFVFHSAMLIAGAVWAQDAWGRYWAWDPLETWAFATWLVMVFAFHVRVSYRLSATLERLMMVGVFLLAFLTFFGVPFLSSAPHKGAV
jgi:ABC-type transport system involved in cytochrome c biogenesis permease subunit